MGAAARRRRTRATTADPRREVDEFTAGQAAHADGLYQAMLFGPEDRWRLVRLAMNGDRWAFLYGLAIEQFLAEICRPDRARPFFCSTCEAELKAENRPCAIVILHPDHSDPRDCMAFGFCPSCVLRMGDRSALKSAVFEVLHRQFPQMRIVCCPIAESAGHA